MSEASEEDPVLEARYERMARGFPSMLWKNQLPPGMAMLMVIAENGYEAVERALASGDLDPKGVAEDGVSYFLTAIAQGKAMTELFIEHGADARRRHRHKWPLAHAYEGGYWGSVPTLIKAGAIVNVRVGGKPIIFIAARGGQYDFVDLMLKGPLDSGIGDVSAEGATVLHAMFHGSPDKKVLKRVLREPRVDVNARLPDTFENASFAGQTVLHFAVARTRQPAEAQQLTRALLKAGADPNVRDFLGRTPLCLALCWSQKLGLLLAQGGADLSGHWPCQAEWCTPLDLVGKGVEALLEIGLAAGVSPDYDAGETILARAVCKGSLAAVELLLRAGADPNRVTANGRRDDPKRLPLLNAIQKKRADIAGALLQAGAAWHVPSLHREPLTAYAKDPKTEAVLVRGGAPPAAYARVLAFIRGVSKAWDIPHRRRGESPAEYEWRIGRAAALMRLVNRACLPPEMCVIIFCVAFRFPDRFASAVIEWDARCPRPAAGSLS